MICLALKMYVLSSLTFYFGPTGLSVRAAPAILLTSGEHGCRQSRVCTREGEKITIDFTRSSFSVRFSTPHFRAEMSLKLRM